MDKDKQEIYLPPVAEAIEMLVQMMICQSGGINDMNREDGSEW